MSLPYHEKGYRLLRVGETIRAGDFKPAGLEWVPVEPHLIGTEAQGSRAIGIPDERELFMRPRLRRISKSHEARLAARGLQINRGG